MILEIILLHPVIQKIKISWRNSDDDGGDNSDDDDFEGDNYDENTCSDDDDEEFEGPRKRRRAQPKGPKGPKQKIVIPKNRPNFYGAVPGVEVGRIWETRMACCADGIQRPTVAGIHAGNLNDFNYSSLFNIKSNSYQVLKVLIPSHFLADTKTTLTQANVSRTRVKAAEL